MEQKSIIYTYGNENITATQLVALLQPHHINCVADCRPLTNFHIASNTPLDELKDTLHQYNIAYIPFFTHFGLFPPEVRSKRGTILYKRATTTPNFLQGVERLRNGIKKGYRICIINEESNIYKSIRFTIIAKHLKEHYEIIHLFPNGHYFSQEQVEHKKEEIRLQRQKKNATIQAIGINGEEIAALYLSNKGYQILDHNWNLYRGCELDIVAMKDNKLHFVEVKTRTSDKYGEPQMAINHRKMKNILHAIHTYRYKRAFFNMEYQIDCMAIIYRAENDYDLKHFLGIRTDGQACTDVHTYHARP